MQQSQTDNAEIGTRVQVDEELTLDHVVGQDEAVKYLKDLVNRILYTDLYNFWAVPKPKAIALTGPPGCGKTYSIRALANEVNCPLMELPYEQIASHLYDESIRRLSAFKNQVDELAKQHGHVLVFIDEADSLFQSRFETNAHSSDKKKTNFFLRWIDGDLEGSSNFTIIATSNAWETVDPALRRSGRFVEIKYKALSPEDVKKALMVHMSLVEAKLGRLLFDKREWTDFKMPEGISGADVKEMINKTLLNRANAELEEFKKTGVLPVDHPLITTEELLSVVKQATIDSGSTIKKRVGFVRD